MENEIIFEWTDNNVEHIRRHNVEIGEIESIFQYKIYKKKIRGRLQILGKTNGGRIIMVIIERIKKGTYKVISARDANYSEKDLYIKRSK